MHAILANGLLPHRYLWRKLDLLFSSAATIGMVSVVGPGRTRMREGPGTVKAWCREMAEMHADRSTDTFRGPVDRVQELQNARGIFGEVVRTSPIPMVITDPALSRDPILYANEAFLQTSGYDLGEVLGQEPHFMARRRTDTVAIELISAALAEGRSETVEMVYYRKDGSAFPAVLFAASVSDDDGQVRHVFSYLNPSEAGAIQRSQIEADKTFRRLVEGVTDYAIYMLDPEGYVASWNSGAERIKGYTANEIVGQHFSRFYTEEEERAGVPQKTLETAMREGRMETEGWRIRKDGSKFLAHVVVDAIRHEETDELVGFAKITRDVTERQRARDAERASEAKTLFLASMSHELRTPLNGIIGYTERLMDEALTPDQRRYAERIQTAGSALLTIINDILDLSQIESGSIELDERPFSLEALIDNTVSIISGVAEAKGLSVRLSFEPELPRMLVGDEARLRQVLLNLLNNAVKFTEQGHISLDIRTERRSGQRELLRFSVSDTGIGIPYEKRHRLFRRFSQVDTTIRREFGGTGLGLAISKRLVELMGGEIGLESEEGRGSTFWFTAALAEAGPDDIASAEESAPQPTASARILLAEDLEINQELARSILERAGHQVEIVSNGAEAVAAARSDSYDLILMDIQMPVMDGLTAGKQIRQLDPPASTVPLIAMTANVLPQQVRSFKLAGFDDHIGKPMKRADLLKKLSDWLPAASLPKDSTSAEPSIYPLFDQEAFDALQELVGQERTVDWLKRLAEQLDAAFTDQALLILNREQVRRSSHALVSTAGTLGLFDLSHACRELEQACASGQELHVRFEKGRRAASSAREVITKLLERRSESRTSPAA